jgi:hypothetical protein
VSVPFTGQEIAALDAACPIEIMRFTLTFDGQLRASGNSSRKAKDKWDIRQAIHPQLAELWQTNPILAPLGRIGVRIPIPGSYLRFEQHHSVPVSHPEDQLGQTNIIGPIEVGGKKFIPLIREEMSLICELDVLFLRKEEPGNLITQGGDIDNRIKTLFDGLRMPTVDEMQAMEGDVLQPFYCLLQSDSLISGFKVRTGKLLSQPDAHVAEVRLVIDVTVKAVHVRGYNLPLLGD